jgi:histone H1/5
MSVNGEGDAPVVEAAPVEVQAAAEETKKAEKVVKEKKPRAPREKKPKQLKTAAHPPYFQMIKEALLSLNEKSGSSPYAIAKYMEEKHKAVLPANFKKILALQLKNSAARGKLIKIRASYKLSEAGKKDKVTSKAAKKTSTDNKPKQTNTKSTATPKARPTTRASKKPEKTKKPAKKAKKSTPAKPKQPKSIKSPAAKKAKKNAA